MNRMLWVACAGLLCVSGFPLRAEYTPDTGPSGARSHTTGTVTFQMDRLDSVRAFWARYYGAPLPYHERDDEDLQDSIARCVLSFIKYKARRLDTVILYAGRDPGDEQHLICHVFPLDEAAYHHMCGKLGLEFVSADEPAYRLTCGSAELSQVGFTGQTVAGRAN